MCQSSRKRACLIFGTHTIGASCATLFETPPCDSGYHWVTANRLRHVLVAAKVSSWRSDGLAAFTPRQQERLSRPRRVSCSTISQRARFSLASRCGGGPNDSKKGWGSLAFRWALGLVRDRRGSPQRVPNEGSLVTLMQGHSFWATRAADH